MRHVCQCWWDGWGADSSLLEVTLMNNFKLRRNHYGLADWVSQRKH